MFALLRRCRLHRSMFRIGTPFPYVPYRQRDAPTNSITEAPHMNSASSVQNQDNKIKNIPKRIVFGSCSSQNGNLSYWDRIVEQTPDLIILMGDNVYPPPMIQTLDQAGSSPIEKTMSSAYQCLGSNPSFIRAVNSKIPIIATLDDNDYNLRCYQYGKNMHHPMMTKEEIDSGLEMTKQEFLRFFRVNSTDERWTKHGRGVYTSYDYYTYENGSAYLRCSTDTVNGTSDDNAIDEIEMDSNKGQVMWRLQIILLDVRRHKSSFALQDTFNPNDEKCTGPYIPSYDKQRTMLGACQWKWFEEQLGYDSLPPSSVSTNENDKHILNHKPNLRIVVSPIQVLSDGRHGWDCWSLFPHERERLLELLFHQSSSSVVTLPNQEQSPKFIPTVLLSGDRHVAGFYKHELYTDKSNNTSKRGIMEVTSSSLTHSVPAGLLDHEIDTTRDGNFIYGNNFGVLQVNDISITSTDNIDINDDGVTVSIHCAKTGTLLDRRAATNCLR